MTGCESDAVDDTFVDALSTTLRDLATRGLGVVLGASSQARHDGRLRRVSRKDLADVLSRLYTEHYQELVAFARRQLADRSRAEDVVQRAFEKVWKRSPDPAALDNPAAYLVTACRNEIHRELRRTLVERDRTAAPSLVDAEHLGGRPTSGQDSGTCDVGERVADRLAVRDGLAALPTREREAVVPRLQWQLSVEETAAVMGVSAGAVKGYTHHGVRKLRERLAVA